MEDGLMDRFTRGLIAGIISSIIMNVWDFISFYLLKFSNLLYLDWASIMIYGDKPANLSEYMFSLITQIAWSSLLAIFFTFLIPHITSKNYLIKGAFYGFIISFIIYSVPVLYKIHYLQNVSTNTAISHAIGSTLWGVVLALMLRWLDITLTINN